MTGCGRLRDIGGAFVDLLLPPTCLVCGAAMRELGPERLCGSCRRDVPWVSSPCPRCSGTEPHAGPACRLCRSRQPSLPVRHVGWYDGTLRTLILGAKWQDLRVAVPILAGWCVAAARTNGWAEGLDGYCAVPRDPWRRLRHGLPLSEHLGREIGRRLTLPRLRAPRRRVRRPQMNLSGRARRRNLTGVFHTSPRMRGRWAGRRILVVDDVFTTGSTIEAFADALRTAGAADVRALVVAAQPDA